jgi:hypothetical protein
MCRHALRIKPPRPRVDVLGRAIMPGANLTTFANQAVSLAEIFNVGFAKRRVEGPSLYSVELSAPDGPSTAGGKQAIQHLKLIPEGGGATLLIGTVNMVEHQVELRTFRHVDELHRQRFKGAPFGGEPASYQQLLDAIGVFLSERKYAVTVSDRVPTIPVPVHAGNTPVPVTGVANLPASSPLRFVLTVTVTAALVVVTALILKH